MFEVTFYKSMNVRTGEVPLRFRLREDKDVDLALETGIMVPAVDLQAFRSDGAVRPGLIDWNPISRTHTLEQMLEEIGEPVYRWKRKEVVE